MMQPAGDDLHRAAVARDYDRRTDEWRTIYEGQSFHDHTIRERLFRTLALADRAGPPGPALDVGCGAGQLLVALARRGWSVDGCDVSEGMVAVSRELLAREGLAGEVRQADAAALPYDAGTFRLVTALGMIEYLADPDAGLRELARVTAPGGHVVVTAPNPFRLAYVTDPLGVLRARLAPPKGGYRRHYWSAGQLRRAVARAGLAVADVDGHGFGPLTFAGVQLLNDRRAIRLDARLERVLPASLRPVLGANLIALAVRP